ncbi:YSIRK-type signal peptide-containing protein, partial [Streptococcus sp.]
MKQFKMNERQRFSIRKFSIGAASVLLGSVFFVANPATEVQAAEANTEVLTPENVKPDNSSALSSSDTSNQNLNVEQEGAKANTQETEKKEPGTPSKDDEGKAKVEETSTEGTSKLESNKELAEKQDQPKTDIELSRQLNTQNLESLLSEIDAVKTEKYTEESVAALKAKAEEARQVLATAQNQAEVDAAFRTLVSYKNTGLRRVKKNVEPKAPKLDTTNGKATVGLKAENTEPNGTNIAGHNHSLNGTTFTEGSGFRAIPEGDVTLSHYDRSLTTEVGKAPDARFLLKWRKGQGYSPQVTTGGIGIYLEYERQLPNTGNFVERIFYSKGSTNTVGSYRAVFRMADRSNGTVYGYQGFDITVKPLAPTVTIENLDNTAGKISKVTATARNSSDSSVDFYVNGAKKATVKANNGIAEWTPTEVFNANDRVSATNTARDKEYLEGETIGGTTRIPISTATSNMSREVVIPTPVAPTVNKDELQALVDEAPSIKTTAAYYNAPENNRNAYDEAITTGDTALKKQNVQQDELNTNRDKIKEAKKGLTGQATNTDALTRATGTDADSTKATDAKYYNAD